MRVHNNFKSEDLILEKKVSTSVWAQLNNQSIPYLESNRLPPLLKRWTVLKQIIYSPYRLPTQHKLPTPYELYNPEHVMHSLYIWLPVWKTYPRMDESLCRWPILVHISDSCTWTQLQFWFLSQSCPNFWLRRAIDSTPSLGLIPLSIFSQKGRKKLQQT